MEAKRIEGLWDCVYCDTKGIKARYSECTACGKPRGIETVFYLPNNIKSAVLSEEEKANTTDRADWLCAYCDSYNRSDIFTCARCGKGRDEAVSDYGFLHKLTGQLFKRK